MARLSGVDLRKWYGQREVVRGVSPEVNQGEIVGRGTHDELMESNEIYREIANSQLDSPSLTEE